MTFPPEGITDVNLLRIYWLKKFKLPAKQVLMTQNETPVAGEKPRSNNTRYFYGIALIFAYLTGVVIFSTPEILEHWGFSRVSGQSLVINRLLIWLGLAGLWFYARKVEKQKLILHDEIEYPARFYFPAILILLVIITTGSSLISLLTNLVFHQSGSMRLNQLILIMKGNFLLLFFVSATAGITEEIIFRGYIQTRIEKIFKGPWPAIIITSLLFAVLHASYGTLLQVMVPLFIGLVFSWFYWKYRSIRILIIVHFIYDLATLLILVNKL